MQVGLELIRERAQTPFLIAAAGFEDRAPHGLIELGKAGISLSGCALFTYPGPEHEANFHAMASAARATTENTATIHRFGTTNLTRIFDIVAALPQETLIVLDITAFARHPLLALLSGLADTGRPLWLIYSEAEEYYPTLHELRQKLGADCLGREGIDEAFFRLAKYEETDVVYSANCRIEEVESLAGRHLPNYPLLLIAFLTFKRSRLSAVLREYEASARVLIEGVPEREDLAWRRRAMEIINFDLVEEFRNSITPLNTLKWKETRDFLEQIYSDDGNCYRYNILLAPLGSKMQTVGSWAFARRHKKVKLVTSTPARHFHEKYSCGARDIFLIDDLLAED